MNFNDFTITSQEAVAKATGLATAKQNPAIETSLPEHYTPGSFSKKERYRPSLPVIRQKKSRYRREK